MDPVRDELLLTDDHEETDDDESDETDDVSKGDRWMMGCIFSDKSFLVRRIQIFNELNIDICRSSWISS